MEKLFVALSVFVLSISVSASALAATSANYQSQCEVMITKLKGSGNFGEICAQIKTAEAFRCLHTVVASDYIQNAWGWGIDMRLGRSTFYACGEVTPQAIGVVEQMLEKHPDTSSDLIRLVGRATSKSQVECLAQTIHQDRSDVDADNILTICPK